MTASGVQALNVGIRAVLDPGDEALVLTPAWPNGFSNIAMANAIPRQIPQPLCGDRYGIDFDALEAAITPRTRLLLYTSPSNPLGWVATEDDQRRLLDFSRRDGLWLLADECTTGSLCRRSFWASQFPRSCAWLRAMMRFWWCSRFPKPIA